jgi:hypothetical protein
MATFGDPCEVCGRPATTLVQDREVGAPVEGTDGKMYGTFAPVGPVHAFCEAHKRAPVRKMLSETGAE